MMEITDLEDDDKMQEAMSEPLDRSHTACRRRRILKAKESRLNPPPRKIYSKRLLEIIKLMNA